MLLIDTSNVSASGATARIDIGTRPLRLCEVDATEGTASGHGAGEVIGGYAVGPKQWHDVARRQARAPGDPNEHLNTTKTLQQYLYSWYRPRGYPYLTVDNAVKLKTGQTLATIRRAPPTSSRSASVDSFTEQLLRWYHGNSGVLIARYFWSQPVGMICCPSADRHYHVASVLPKRPVYRPRGYLHFDVPVKKGVADSIALSPERVRHHHFRPLIQRRLSLRRVSFADGMRKFSTKSRTVMYASHVDRHVFDWYKWKLACRLEDRYAGCDFADSVLAYRRLGSGTTSYTQAIDAFQEVSERRDCFVQCIDVSDFFGTLDHKLLKSAWLGLLASDDLPEDHYAVFRRTTKYAFVEKKVLGELRRRELIESRHEQCYCTDEQFRSIVKPHVNVNKEPFGIPQGLPHSACLSNAYLFDFDTEVSRLLSNLGVSYRRYSDDILLIGPTNQLEAATDIVRRGLRMRKLESNPGKDQTSIFSDGKTSQSFDYLGLSFDGRKVSLRSRSLSAYYSRVQKEIRREREHATTEDREIRKARIRYKHTHLGSGRFIKYARNVAAAVDRSLLPCTGKEIKKTIARHVHKIEKYLDKAEQLHRIALSDNRDA